MQMPIILKTLGAAALAAGMALPVLSALAAETYWTDQGHTEVRFGWSHAGVSMQHGEFTRASGKLTLDPDNPEQSSIDVTIDAASVSTGVEALDKHLRDKDFLDVETYPAITFRSTSVRKTADDAADVTGDLTIRGVTLPATLKVRLTHRGAHPVAKFVDYYKGNWVAFSATAEIDHQAFKVGSFSTGPISIWISTELKDREK